MLTGVARAVTDQAAGWQLRLMVAVGAPTALLLGVASSVTAHASDGMLVRFVNAGLTSFTLASFILMVLLVVYGDRRKRPIAPLAGMLVSGVVGALVTAFFLGQGDLLMEDNGSVRAQMLSNTVRFSTSLLALMLSGVLTFGVLLATVLHRGKVPLLFEEE